jgi:hypothetical protein
MTLLRPNFRPESWAQNAGNGISGVQISKNFRGGMPPDPPSIAGISAMIPSDLRLDPPRNGALDMIKHDYTSVLNSFKVPTRL